MKLQKVITVNVLSRVGSNQGEKEFKEMEFPILDRYLSQGYYVAQVHQIAPSPQLYVVTLTFILEKLDG